MFISEAFAQSATPAAGGPDMSMLIMIGGMFAFMYFLIIRPQSKRAKEHKGMLDSLKNGDEVIVSGGMLGKIVKLGDAYIDIEIAPNTQIHVQRGAVQTLLPKGTIKSIA